jgi:hypothetical protein
MREAVDGMEIKGWNLGMVWFVPDAIVGGVADEAWDTLARLLDRLVSAMPIEAAPNFTAPIAAAHALLALRQERSSTANRDAAREALAAIAGVGAPYGFAPLRDRLQAALA